MKRIPSVKESPADEQRAFETLPQGVRPKDIRGQMTSQEMEVIRKQALGQASRFEILTSRDVDNLSRVSLLHLLVNPSLTNDPGTPWA